MKKRKIIVGILILSIIGLGIYFSKKPKVFLVTPVDLETTTIQKTVSASGEVKAVKEANLALVSTGLLEYLSVKKGDQVKENVLLAYIYNYDSTQSAQALKDARDVAKHDLDLFIENYETYPNGVGGKDEYNIGLARLKELLSKAEASYQSSLGSLSKTYLYAPFDGTILDIYVDEAEVVTAGSPIIKIADLSNLIFEISVDQEDFGLVKLGQKVAVNLDSYEGKVFAGIVSELPKYADETSKEFLIKIELEQNPETPILLGMDGDASIIVEEVINASALTFDVVHEENGGHYIWVVENGILKKEEVEIGLEGDVYTEIKTNLGNKEIVVPTAENGLEEGSKVKFEE